MCVCTLLSKTYIIDYPYKWEWDDGTYYSIMSKEEYEKYIEDDWDRIKKLEEENKKLKEICDVYVPRTLKLEENKKLQEKVNTYSEEYGKLREENRNLKEKVQQMQENYENLNDAYTEILWENIKLKEEIWKFIMKS